MKKITEIIGSFVDFINGTLVPLLFAVALVVFLYGVFRYFILGGANEEKRSEGRKLVIYSIVGFAIMVSVWGLVNLVVNTFGFDSNTRPCLPTFGGGCSNSSGGSSNGTTKSPSTNQPTAPTPEPLGDEGLPLNY